MMGYSEPKKNEIYFNPKYFTIIKCNGSDALGFFTFKFSNKKKHTQCVLHTAVYLCVCNGMFEILKHQKHLSMQAKWST